MEFSLITNDPRLAQAAQDAGVERILIDVERLGKSERQAGRRLFLSEHTLEDIARVRRVLTRAKLTVRVDPPHAGSGKQVERAIGLGADCLMLPYFHSVDEARAFIDIVGGRARPILLVETKEAAAAIAELARLPGLAEIHIGLNDLSHSMGMPFLLDPVADGTVAGLCSALRASGVPFGFGGIGSLSRRDLPVDPELVLAEQAAQGASIGWLGRTFREAPPETLGQEIILLREAVARWGQADRRALERMRSALQAQIQAAGPR